jgi:hypothetical protein
VLLDQLSEPFLLLGVRLALDAFETLGFVAHLVAIAVLAET